MIDWKPKLTTRPATASRGEFILLAQRKAQTAQDYEREQQCNDHTEQDSEFFGATEKMKSVWLSGRIRFAEPSPGPLPSQPPPMVALQRRICLKRVALTGQELVDAGATCGNTV